MELQECISEFKQIVDEIYGTYLDSIEGFRLLIKDTKRHEEEIKQRYNDWKESNPQYKNVKWGGAYRGFGRLRKDGQRMHLHQVSFEEIISRNSYDGRNPISIANYCLVTIYQYWEDHFRKLIADCLSMKQKDVQVPLFGDINLMRKSIIHHRAIAKPEIEKCQILKWFKKGESIRITKNMFEELIDKILDCLDKIGADPKSFLLSN